MAEKFPKTTRFVSDLTRSCHLLTRFFLLFKQAFHYVAQPGLSSLHHPVSASQVLGSQANATALSSDQITLTVPHAQATGTRLPTSACFQSTVNIMFQRRTSEGNLNPSAGQPRLSSLPPFFWFMFPGKAKELPRQSSSLGPQTPFPHSSPFHSRAQIDSECPKLPCWAPIPASVSPPPRSLPVCCGEEQ